MTAQGPEAVFEAFTFDSAEKLTILSFNGKYDENIYPNLYQLPSHF